MRIYRDLKEVTYDENSIVTLGTFDGVHIGHREIIDTVVKKADELGGRSFVITFYPHPRKVISGNNQLKLLNTPDEKAVLLEALGIENLLIINFTKEFSQLSPDEFVDRIILKTIGAKEIVIGHDHHFGKGRGGNIDFLINKGKKAGFKVTVIPEYKTEDVGINSSLIRKELQDGEIVNVNKHLGRFYSFTGRVVKGDGRGKVLGFPTANLKTENNDKLLPAIGIYAVELFIDNQKHFGLLSIGRRPTFYEQGELVAEVYIFDFNENIYGKDVTVNVVERIRGEEKFSSADELINRMNIDKKIGLEILKKLNN
ncbi:MAG: bifunctional riboflavin kinase/FAD synthetase [Ignavibacteriaceae bacterium]